MVVLLLGIVFIGPERMPRVAYQVGKAVRTMQSYARAVRNEFREEIDYLDTQYKTIRGEVDEARTAIREQGRQIDSEIKSVTSEVQSAGASLSNVVSFPAGEPLSSAPPASAPADAMPATPTSPAPAASLDSVQQPEGGKTLVF